MGTGGASDHPVLVRQLRHAVLRPFEPPERIVYHGDDDPDTPHAGAFCRRAPGRHRLGVPARGCRRVGEPAAWRLRGMATLPEVRGGGWGRRLLEACSAHIRARGGRLLGGTRA